MKTFRKLLRDLQRNMFLAGLLWCLFSMSICSFAQLSTASLNGFVRDPSGANIPNATVVLRNVDTSVEKRTVSNSAGAYALLDITPGRYTLEASATGFSPTQVSVFTLAVSQIATIDFSLKVGSQSAVVNVQADSAQINLTSANLGTVISTQQVNDLPLNGRNFTQLLSLTPGVAPVNVGQSAGGGFAGTAVAVGSSFIIPAINGQTNRSNFFLSDGMNNYGAYLSTYAVPPIIDAIQEFTIVSHTDSAEFGSVLGGVVNVVTKSGTNTLHGSAWEYDRNTIFDARTYFLPLTEAKTPYSQNQFGGSIGGPLSIPRFYSGKDKTFFFGAYQGFRYRRNSDTPLKVPTAAQLAGDESAWPTQIFNPFTTRPDPANPGQYIRDTFAGNQIPASLIDPRMVAWANFLFPKAGSVFDSSGDNAIDSTPLTQNQNEFDVRVDQKVGANDTAFFRYSFFNSNESSSGGLPGTISNVSTPGRNWGGSYVHVFSPSLIVQGLFSRTTVQHNSPTFFAASTASIFSQVGFAAAFAGNFNAVGQNDLLPSPGITGFANAGATYLLIPKATSANQYSGTLTKLAGAHSLQFGGEYITIGEAVQDSYASLGFAGEQTGDTNPADTVNSGDPIASFLLNTPSSATRRNTNEAERPGGVMSLFAQDTWKATDSLTLNFGLRYDLTFIPPFGTAKTIGQEGGIETGDMDFTTGTYIIQKLPPACSVRGYAPCIPGNGTLPANVVVTPRGKIPYNVYTNFGPRFGFAYRVGDKTAVHGAFGIVYDNWAAQVQLSQNLGGNWPDIGLTLASNLNVPTTTSATPTVQAQDPFGNETSSLFPAATPFNQVSYYYDPHLKNPYSEQFNFGVERQLSGSTTVTANYVGSVGKRLDVGGYYNTALTPGPGDPQSRSLFPYVAPTPYDRSIGGSNYNAFQFSLNKRFTNGLAYQVAYTWSKSFDVGGDGWFGAEGQVSQDPYSPSAYGGYALAGTDLRNVISVNTLYQVPVGKGRSFSTGNGVLDYILGHWQVNNIFLAYSGIPFTPVISSDIANTGNGQTYETLDRIGNPNNIAHRTSAEWFNTAAYVVPPGFTYGTSSRNSLRQAAYWDLDTSVFRQFPLGGESRRLEFRAEAFNLLNTVILGTPISDFNTGAEFGTVDTTANTARELQLVMKFIF
jgi:hypothetical protein